MIYFVYRANERIAWDYFCDTIDKKKVAKLGIQIVKLEDTWLKTAAFMNGVKASDTIFLYQNFFNMDFKHKKCKIYLCIHGGLPFSVDYFLPHLVNYYETAKKLLDGFFTVAEHSVAKLKNQGFYVIGYLGLVNDYSALATYLSGKKEDILLCPGRFSVSRLTGLFAYILEPFLKNYRVIFTDANSKESIKEYYSDMTLYLDMMEKMGFEVMYNLKGKEFFKLLAKSKLVVIRGIVDNIAATAMEAAYLCGNVLVPKLPPYTEQYTKSAFYEPFSVSDIREKVADKLEDPFYNARDFSYRDFFVRLKNYLIGAI